jgi:hypothetical protein
MNSAQLKSLQIPIKDRYRAKPEAALVTLRAEGRLGDGLTCKIETGKALVEAGLHPATGGNGLSACSGDMLLEALVACASVTLNAVATALDIKLRDATVRAEGDPFLIASNIGAAATVLGNPQDMMIAQVAGLDFGS